MDERFRHLLLAHGPALVRLATSYANTVADRDDLFQEIAIAIWKALPQFRGESSERTFIFRIAHNRAISYVARRRLPVSAASELADMDVPDPGPSPEAGLLREERTARLQASVVQLPIEYRQVVTLALEGLSYSDIAQVAGISENNVGVRLNRARQMLRRLMEETA